MNNNNSNDNNRSSLYMTLPAENIELSTLGDYLITFKIDNTDLEPASTYIEEGLVDFNLNGNSATVYGNAKKGTKYPVLRIKSDGKKIVEAMRFDQIVERHMAAENEA